MFKDGDWPGCDARECVNDAETVNDASWWWSLAESGSVCSVCNTEQRTGSDIWLGVLAVIEVRVIPAQHHKGNVLICFLWWLAPSPSTPQLSRLIDKLSPEGWFTYEYWLAWNWNSLAMRGIAKRHVYCTHGQTWMRECWWFVRFHTIVLTPSKARKLYTVSLVLGHCTVGKIEGFPLIG